MFKRLLASVLAVGALVFSLPAQATLTNSNTAAQHGSSLFYSALVTATGNDTTDPADSNAITNLDGSIKDICASVRATNQTGTSPTLQLIFLGAHTSSGPWFIIQTDDTTAGTTADADAVGTLSISTASSTNVAQGVCTSNFGIVTLPPYVKIRVDIGGTSTPGWTGVLSALVKR
jgi:hypothetical protein